MRRNDPFNPPPAALARASAPLPQSKAKWDVLFQPERQTGVPLGGIGTGGIMRSSTGTFSRWTLKGGGVKTFTLPAAGFVLRTAAQGEAPQVQALQSPPEQEELGAFRFRPADRWEGLFPKAWHHHDPAHHSGVEAQCLSFSPFIPGDLEAASLPVAVFRWQLTNSGETAADVSLAFLFANLNGWFTDFGEGRPERPATGTFNRPLDGDGVFGVILDRAPAGPARPEGSGQWAIACAAEPGLSLSRTLCFDGLGDGAAFWAPFRDTGEAPDLGESWVVEGGFRENLPGLPTGAVAAAFTLDPRESRIVTFTLVWDLPVITFGQGRRWYRKYTDTWGIDGTAAGAISRHALASAPHWLSAIDDWHDTVAAAAGGDPHRAGMAINELYFLVDGLSVFTSARDAPDGRAHFGLIECHDYALYNTLDLWIYAAEAVGRHFPELAAMVIEDYADLTVATDLRQRRHRWHHGLFAINDRGCCPHDIGGPSEDPFVVPNAYTYRDGNLWKDLNSDLVLCIYRDGQAMDRDWRVRQFPAVRMAIDHLQQFDRDGDGLIENDGTPDQTFDNIPMKGASSYCGGLWIAALKAGAALAAEAGEADLAAAWSAQADKAGQAYAQKLFNGSHFLVDTDGPLSAACFIEQLFGPFLARRLGLGDIVPEAMAVSALKTIYERNFLEAGGGEGAVSLASVPPDAVEHLPHANDRTFQTSEIQPGFNFSLAAQLEAWGLDSQADTLRRALHHQLHVRRNLVFQTPAAFDREALTCRAIMNMRSLAVWWMLPPVRD